MLNSSSNTEALLSNCILWHNADLGGQDESAQIHNDFDAATVVNHSAVQEWSGTMEGVGNITEAPVCVDADGQDNIAGNRDDAWRLLAGSPGVDGGDNGAVPQGVVVDLNGQARFVDDPAATDSGQGTPPVVDMGAYESQVDCNATGIYDSGDIADETSFDCHQYHIPD